MKKAKEDWIGAQCEETETCLNKNNSNRAYQLKKDLTSEKQGSSSTIQDRSGKCVTEEQIFLVDGQNTAQENCDDNAVLDCSQPPEDLKPILHKEIAGPRSTIGRTGVLGLVSQGSWFDTRSGNILLFLLPLFQEGQLSVTGESMCTKYWLTA